MTARRLLHRNTFVDIFHPCSGDEFFAYEIAAFHIRGECQHQNAETRDSPIHSTTTREKQKSLAWVGEDEAKKVAEACSFTQHFALMESTPSGMMKRAGKSYFF